MASEGGAGRKQGRKRLSVGTGTSSCLGSLPDTKQSNVLLILITEMILIRTGARATLPSYRVGPHWEGGGGKAKKGHKEEGGVLLEEPIPHSQLSDSLPPPPIPRPHCWKQFFLRVHFIWVSLIMWNGFHGKQRNGSGGGHWQKER